MAHQKRGRKGQMLVYQAIGLAIIETAGMMILHLWHSYSTLCAVLVTTRVQRHLSRPLPHCGQRRNEVANVSGQRVSFFMVSGVATELNAAF
jgi:hypothetical protein